MSFVKQRGFIAKPIQTNENIDEFSRTRFLLRQGWNTNWIGQTNYVSNVIPQSPFRIVNNSGDLLGRRNYSCGGACQTPQSRPGLKGLSKHFGAIQNNCDGTQVPPAACNVKYVYDSSDYTRYLRQRQAAKTYVDPTFGGDSSNTTQTNLSGSLRFF
jgi:hypothetical protein